MRPDIHRYFTDMARLVGSRSTCLRRSVGCVLVDHRHRVLATGYNGVAAGDAHCNEAIKVNDLPATKLVRSYVKFPHACSGVNARSGQSLDSCRAVHAEQNAILQCPDADKVSRAYVSTFPCPSCAKLLLNTGCREIVFLDGYGDGAGYDLWVKAGRVAWKYEGEPPMIQRDLVRLYDDEFNEWRVLIACVCLNLASARVARGIIMRILQRWPTPAYIQDVEIFDLESVLEPLGLSKRRAASIKSISLDIGTKPLAELAGVGPYALESVAVFCHNKRPHEVNDRKVRAWVEWARQHPKEL